jgi:cysteine desulfurase family protein (TIGR01976 family)
MTSVFPIDAVRAQFPGLRREVSGRPAIFFDGPAGSQVPRRVARAVSDYLLGYNANHGGSFASAQESDAILAEAHRALADYLGAEKPEEIAFGANMTTLTFALSRALARTWNAGDEIVVTRLDHDANVSTWELAARDAGAVVRHVGIRPDDCTLDLDVLRSCLSERTRLVAVGAASNLVGTINPIREIAALAHDAGAQIFVDAVHLAPHRAIDVVQWDCDYLACSAYKFFGPHVGVLWGRAELLAELPAYKVRAASDALPDRWMTGTQCHEGIAGALEAVAYLADLGREIAGQPLDRRAAIRAAFEAVEAYERSLCRQLLEGIAVLPGSRVVGIADLERLEDRTPTVGIVSEDCSPVALSEELGKRGVFTWGGNSYALPLTEALDLEPHGVLRVGLLHYNTVEEVERFLSLLPDCIAAVSAKPRLYSAR